jgi:hypothetical protein
MDEEKTYTTYRVFKSNTKQGWDNMGTLETESYRPTSTELGEEFGVGSYMYVKNEDYEKKGYVSASFVTIEAQTYYSEKYDDDVES